LSSATRREPMVPLAPMTKIEGVCISLLQS
jgi:hypothetical protein